MVLGRAGKHLSLMDHVSQEYGLKYYAERLLDTCTAYARWGTISIGSNALNGRRPSVDRHLALLAWWFPPCVTGGTYRPAALVKRAEEFGWRVTVIAGTLGEESGLAGNYLQRQVPKTIRVERVPEAALLPSYKWFPAIDGEFINVLETYDLAKKLFDDRPPAVVIASGPPFHNFVAAMYLSRRYKAKLVLDYRDEWSQCPFEFVKHGADDCKWESRCVEHADALLFTTQSQLDHHSTHFTRVHPRKRYLVPNGWDPDDFLELGCKEGQAEKSKHVELSFLGALSGHCLPGRFLRAIEKILDSHSEFRQSLRLKFVGYKSPVAKRELEVFRYQSLIEVLDVVPKPTAIKMMRTSTALLLFNDARYERYLPGKLYEYLAAGSPIVVFGKGGETGELVERLNAGFVISDEDPIELHRVLTSLGAGVRPPKDPTTIKNWLKEHSREEMARKIFQIIEAICDDSVDAAFVQETS